MNSYRWAIIGSGNMARRMAATLHAHPRAELAGFVTGSPERAAELRRETGVAATSSIDDLEVDVAYVASVSSRHGDDVAACLDARIAVLCEKPLATDLATVVGLQDHARASETFVMEAMWSRFLPVGRTVAARRAAGDYADARLVVSALGYLVDRDPSRRWFGDAAGSGVVLDLGVYGLDLALQVLGPPLTTEVAVERVGSVITQAVVLGTHADGALSSTTVTFDADLAGGASIITPRFTDTLMGEFQRSSEIRRVGPSSMESTDCSYPGEGLAPEVDEVHAALDRGAIESSVLSHRATVDLHRWVAEVVAASD